MKMKSFIRKSQRGFSLTELLIVLVIISVLVLLALPRLMPLVTKAKTKEAQIALATIKTLQNAYKLEHDKYADSLEKLGFQQEKLISEGGTARYKVEIIKASLVEFEVNAIAIVDFDDDGTFNLWKVTQDGQVEEVVED